MSGSRVNNTPYVPFTDAINAIDQQLLVVAGWFP